MHTFWVINDFKSVCQHWYEDGIYERSLTTWYKLSNEPLHFTSSGRNFHKKIHPFYTFQRSPWHSGRPKKNANVFIIYGSLRISPLKKRDRLGMDQILTGFYFKRMPHYNLRKKKIWDNKIYSVRYKLLGARMWAVEIKISTILTN